MQAFEQLFRKLHIEVLYLLALLVTYCKNATLAHCRPVNTNSFCQSNRRVLLPLTALLSDVLVFDKLSKLA